MAANKCKGKKPLIKICGDGTKCSGLQWALSHPTDVPVWSKLESGHLPSMQQLVQILDNEMKMNVHMNTRPHHS